MARTVSHRADRRRNANAVILAEQGRWYTAIVRPLLALPIVIYFWKVIVWDKVLGWGVTDPITGMIAEACLRSVRHLTWTASSGELNRPTFRCSRPPSSN